MKTARREPTSERPSLPLTLALGTRSPYSLSGTNASSFRHQRGCRPDCHEAGVSYDCETRQSCWLTVDARRRGQSRKDYNGDGTRTDARHAATAIQAECALFITNDADFRRVPGLPVVVLDDLLRDSSQVPP